jgi:glutamate-5-semialdehyde dehydrogenase
LNSAPLTKLESGMRVIVAGDRIMPIPAALAERFRPGDSIVYSDVTDELLLIPSAEKQVAALAVTDALRAFEQMRSVSDEQVNRFYTRFAHHLATDAVWSGIQQVNQLDVEDARRRERSTTRLIATERLRQGMIEGLLGWSRMPTARGRVLETIEHSGWAVDLVAAELGVVAFVFEGRPNVLADATGVLKGGNTVVFRIGRDALRTASAIMEAALVPALVEAGLPVGAVRLVQSAEHAAGWALFGDRRLSLAVARGSGQAVAALGGLARQAGVPVSLHGTGGAWLVATAETGVVDLERNVMLSLDRKVCNTLNVCCVPRAQAAWLVPAFLRGLAKAGERRHQAFKLHVVKGDETEWTRELFKRTVPVARPEGVALEPQAELLGEAELGREWEWEETPEVTLKLVDGLDHAVRLFNAYSPQFVASLISSDAAEQRRFFETINAPFVGDSHTRWVDGQLALRRPELGLSNWEYGRLLGRGGVLSGDGIFTIRTRARKL